MELLSVSESRGGKRTRPGESGDTDLSSVSVMDSETFGSDVSGGEGKESNNEDKNLHFLVRFWEIDYEMWGDDGIYRAKGERLKNKKHKLGEFYRVNVII